MRINGISVCNVQNVRIFRQQNKTKYPQKNISFRGAPWELNPFDFGVPSSGSISGDDAKKLYSKLSCGNFLDIGNDKINFNYCNKIREKNLAFLDRVTSPEEQKSFIEHYKELTGFPNLKTVSEKIKNELIKAIYNTSHNLCSSYCQVEQAGYDGVCSVGRKKALPGSDIDKAYVIIKGTGDTFMDQYYVNKFKGGIWNETDQRILSYNHDEAAFPQVYTLAQLKELTAAAEDKAQIHYGYVVYDGRGCPMHNEEFNRNRYYIRQSFEDKLNTYNPDYVEANKFYINVCNEIPSYSLNGIDKESIKNVGFVLEAMREGETFSQFGKIDDSSITDSLVYKYVNLSQLRALKNHNDRKPKRLARESLPIDFPSWNIDKQFRFIKTLIKSACANNRAFTTEFQQYFSKPGQDLFAPLIKALMR